jgi:ketosteroid isomerase-like protein
MTPKQIVELWIEKFNNADIEGLIELYAVDAVNHQVVTKLLKAEKRLKNFLKLILQEQKWSAFRR